MTSGRGADLSSPGLPPRDLPISADGAFPPPGDAAPSILFASGFAAFPDGSHLDTMRAARPQGAAKGGTQMPGLRSLADQAMHDEPPQQIAALHAYWFCLGDGEPPQRRLINPAAIAPLLPDLLLLEADDVKDDAQDGAAASAKAELRLRYRLTGTRIDHWNGCNLTGRYLDEIAAIDTTGITDFITRHCRDSLRSGRAYIGHYDWYARPLDMSPEGRQQRWSLLIPAQRPIRLWLGLFPLKLNGRLRQCLAIAEHDGLPIDSAPAPWILDSDGHPAASCIPGRWRSP